jgi:hypothetical protein
MTLMDSIKGAIILRDLLDRDAQPDPPQPVAAVPSDAPPIFHWLGVTPEPPFGDA